MSDDLHTVLLFDDETLQREALAGELTAAGFCVTHVASPDAVIREIKERRDRYEFAVFDLVFTDITGNLKDGLQLCGIVAQLDSSLPVVLYHDSSLGDPSSTANKIIIPTLPEAIASGAYRLVVRDGVKRILAGLVDEIRELDELSHELEKLKEARRQMSHLAFGLGVGFQVVDQRGKVWFTDEEFDRIAGRSGLAAMNCFCQSHGYPLAHGPCHNCITIPLIKSGGTEGKDGIFFSPTYPDGPGTPPVFRYLHVRVTPIRSLAPSDGRMPARTIAAIEAVSKVSRSSIEHLPRNDHLAMLACTLQDMGFRRVSIFRFREPGDDASFGTLEGIVARKGSADPEGTVDISDLVVPLARDIRGKAQDAVSVEALAADSNVIFDDVSRAKLGLVSTHPPILAAIFRPDGSCLCFVLLDNADKNGRPPLTISDLQTPKPYEGCIPPSPSTVFEEIGRVLLRKPKAGGRAAQTDELAAMVECERIFEKVRLRVTSIASGNPQTMLEATLKALVAHMSGLSAAHIRRVDGDWAESVAFAGDYGRVAEKRVDIRISKRLTARVARTRSPAIIQNLEKEYGDRPPGWDEFDEASWNAIVEYRSHAIYPLVSGAKILGTVSFQAMEPNVFTTARQHLLKLVCGLLTRSLEDWDIIDQAAVASNLPLRAAMLVAHNLGQPVATIQRYVEAMNRDMQEGLPLNKERLVGIERQCKRMADMKLGLTGLLNAKPGEWKTVQIRPLLEKLVSEIVGDQGIAWGIETDLNVVTIRPGILHACVPVLVKNAVEALTEPPASVRRIDIRALNLDDGTLEVAVCDTGPGVSDTLLSKLFDHMHSSKSGGMGIGLSLAHYLVKSNGGQLGYDRKDGVTVFSLRLPQHA